MREENITPKQRREYNNKLYYYKTKENVAKRLSAKRN
jgi:hypothetical protein